MTRAEARTGHERSEKNVPVARFGARVRVAALSAASEPRRHLGCALVVSANARPRSGLGHWDTSLKSPRFIRHRRRSAAFPVARYRKSGSKRTPASHARQGVEAGSNSPVDCCVSENRASQRAVPRWGGSLIFVASSAVPSSCQPMPAPQKTDPSTGRFFVINTTGAQTFLVKTHSELDAIFTRRALLKLLLMETATFTINAE